MIVIDGDFDFSLADGFVFRIVELSDVGMLKSFLSSKSFVGIELKHETKNVESFFAGIGEKLRQCLWFGVRQTFKKCGSKWRFDGFDIFRSRSSSDFDDSIELIHGRSSGKHGLATKQLTQDATNRPHIHTLGVFCGTQENLRSSVPTSGHVICKNGIGFRIVFKGSDRSGKTEIGSLEETFRVEQEIAGLHVTMKNVGAVHVSNCLEELIHDVLFVDVRKDTSSNDGMQIGFHILEDKIDILVAFGLQHIKKLDDVIMIAKLLQEHNLSEGTLGISSILKSVENLLQSDGFSCLFVNGLPNHTISSFAEFLEDFVFTEHMLVNIF